MVTLFYGFLSIPKDAVLLKISEPYICKDILQNYILFGKKWTARVKSTIRIPYRCFFKNNLGPKTNYSQMFVPQGGISLLFLYWILIYCTSFSPFPWGILQVVLKPCYYVLDIWCSLPLLSAAILQINIKNWRICPRITRHLWLSKSTFLPFFFPSRSFVFTMCKGAPFAVNARLFTLVVPTKAIGTMEIGWSKANSVTLFMRGLLLLTRLYLSRRRFWIIAHSACVSVRISGHLGTVRRVPCKTQITGTGANATYTAGIGVII